MISNIKLLQIKKCDYEQEQKDNTFVFHAYVVATVDDKVFKQKMEELFSGEGTTSTKKTNSNVKISKENEYTLDIFRSTDQIENKDFATAELNLSTIISFKNFLSAKCGAFWTRAVQ